MLEGRRTSVNRQATGPQIERIKGILSIAIMWEMLTCIKGGFSGLGGILHSQSASVLVDIMTKTHPHNKQQNVNGM